MSDLFSNDDSVKRVSSSAPLAERVRPTMLDDFIGQEHLVGADKPLRLMLENGELASMILWGPPGVGKTTLARLIAHYIKADFYQLNAVAAGVKDVRDVIGRAEKNRNDKTILFIDEIHRFNKAQQDALLHSVEEGTVTLIGATTENPSFEVISPLLSRCQVYVLESLGKEALQKILDHALQTDIVFSKQKIEIQDADFLFLLSGGDARKLLNGLENAIRLTKPHPDNSLTITKKKIEEAFQRKFTLYDKEGEQHYDIISAFIKSIRGSDPDAAVLLDGANVRRRRRSEIYCTAHDCAFIRRYRQCGSVCAHACHFVFHRCRLHWHAGSAHHSCANGNLSCIVPQKQRFVSCHRCSVE